MYAKKKSVSMKVVVLLLAVVLLIGCTIGGSVAYLMANTNTVTNTFVVGNIGNLTLTEENDDGDHTTGNEYKIVPGAKIAKNPVVTYTPAQAETGTENVPVYVFVKVGVTTGERKWSVNGKEYSFDNGKVTWTVGDDWTALTGFPGVFYNEIEEDELTAATTLNVMKTIETVNEKAKTIEVSSNIVKNDVSTVATNIGSIQFTAYAIQQDTFADASAAWTALQTT